MQLKGLKEWKAGYARGMKEVGWSAVISSEREEGGGKGSGNDGNLRKARQTIGEK
jgi:hypothetical protein